MEHIDSKEHRIIKKRPPVPQSQNSFSKFREFPQNDWNNRTQDKNQQNDLVSKPAVILAKPPPRRIVNDDEEEWPSIGAATQRSVGGGSSNTSSRVQSPMRPASHSYSVSEIAKSIATGTHDSSTIHDELPLSDRKRLYQPPTVIDREPSSHQIAPVATTSAVQKQIDLTSSISVKSMRSSVKMMFENLEWSDMPSEFLMEQPSNFLVVGVVGCQGVGKSSLASFIAGNNPSDPYRNYIFRPESKECVETGQHQTAGIHMYVNEHRVIVLDAQPLLSPSVLDVLIYTERKSPSEVSLPENLVEIESIEILAFLYQVCHVVVFVTDFFVDVNHMRLLQTAEMLKPSVPAADSTPFYDYFPYLVFVHNKAAADDLAPTNLERKADILQCLFQESKLKVSGVGSIWKGAEVNFDETTINSDINLFVLPEQNFWLKHRFNESESFRINQDFELLIKDLRRLIYSCERQSISPMITNEKTWYLYAAKMWEAVGNSLLISEYSRMLP